MVGILSATTTFTNTVTKQPINQTIEERFFFLFSRRFEGGNGTRLALFFWPIPHTIYPFGDEYDYGREQPNED